MLYRTVPKTGDKLSILGFGYMRLPHKQGGGIDEERAVRQLRYAIDHGVNYVDTAPIYHFGKSETILGRALTEGYRNKVRLATKLPPWSVFARSDMDRILADQLAMLNTDHIDYYLLHSLGKESWDKLLLLGVLEFLDMAKKDGRIINAGFSFHSNTDTFKEIIDAYDWDFCQIQFNYLDEHNQAGIEGLEYAASKRIAVVVMEPLRGGNLAGHVPDDVQKIWDTAHIKRSAAEWGLRWVWNHPEVTVALSGMNDEAHIDENLRVAETALPDSLSESDLTVLEQARQTYRRLMKVDCTGCRYCMPCPAGVNIPECFAFYNNTAFFPHCRENRMLYMVRLGGIIGDFPSYAGLCRHCGKCERICPQHIPIQQRLKEVSAKMEGRGMGARRFIIKGVMGSALWLQGIGGRIRRRVSDRKKVK
jgi:predicted aldo/keto reductase-like oxidoreductase